jgi:hypothetical protein
LLDIPDIRDCDRGGLGCYRPEETNRFYPEKVAFGGHMVVKIRTIRLLIDVRE